MSERGTSETFIFDGRAVPFMAGQSIGAAVRGARLALLKQGNPLGLIYIPFVVPGLRLITAPHEEVAA